MITQTFHFKEGVQFSLAFTHGFAKSIYDSDEFYHSRPFEDFYRSNLNHITSTDRWEYVIADEGRTQASMIFCEDEDVHVGRCMLIMYATNLGAYNLAPGYRTAIKKAKELGIKWLVYTKQITPTEHRVMYKELR